MDTRMLTAHDGQEVVIISQTRVYKTHHVDVQTTVDQMVENSLLNVNPKVGSNKWDRLFSAKIKFSKFHFQRPYYRMYKPLYSIMEFDKVDSKETTPTNSSQNRSEFVKSSKYRTI